MNPVLRYGVWIAIGCLFGASPKVVPAGERSRDRPALVDYFPPAEDLGGWRSLLPEKGDPDPKQKAAIREVAGVDWDKLQQAWRHNEAADGPSGLLVIRRGQVVGEWYKDCDRKSDFNIYSCSKAYTSTAFGLILTDFNAAANTGIKPLSLDTKVCNAEWIPEVLPLTDARKSEITVRHLLNMDLVQCAGFRNNHGYVVPSLDLVFVRVGTGDNYPPDFESDLVKRVVAAVESR